ncbi:uncharacterized protein LOC144102748 [Amblyomma americanum]
MTPVEILRVPFRAAPQAAKRGFFSRLWGSKKAPAAPVQETKPAAAEGGRKTPPVPASEKPEMKDGTTDVPMEGKKSENNMFNIFPSGGRNTPDVPAVQQPDATGAHPEGKKSGQSTPTGPPEVRADGKDAAVVPPTEKPSGEHPDVPGAAAKPE